MTKITEINASTVKIVNIRTSDGDEYRVWPNYPDNDVEFWDINTASFISVSNEQLRQFLINESNKFFNEDDNDVYEPYPIA